MKKVFIFALVFALVMSLAACTTGNVNNSETNGGAVTDGKATEKETDPTASDPSASSQDQTDSVKDTETAESTADDGETSNASDETTNEPGEQKSRILVAYFSCTGNTKAAAERIAALAGGELYEIVPTEPYTKDDINYNNSDCRANTEMNDPNARPGISGERLDMSEYDTIIIGYPIWWGTMPRIINTFLDTYDLSGKAVLPFCTSGGSGISKSVSDISGAEPDANVKNGLRISGTSDGSIEKWLEENAGL